MNTRTANLLSTYHLYIMMTASILCQTVNAGELQLVPRAWTGFIDYSFDQSPRMAALPDGSDFPSVKFDAILVVAGFGLSAVSDTYYFDLSYQDSSEEQDSFSGANFYEGFDGDRRDYSVTLGTRILDNRGNLYFGYKNGKTSGRGNAGTRLTFREDGLFLGASYGWVIANKGLLTINTAFASLNGRLIEIPGPGYPPGLILDAESDTSGLSYGISWNSNISKNFSYSIALDANKYKFDNLKDKANASALPSEIEESIVTGKISIYYHF